MKENQEVLLQAVHHVVHEYANLESSAQMVRTGKHLTRSLEPPLNTHVQHAFLLNCRKMAEFFSQEAKHSDDVRATDFLKPQSVEFELGLWDEWSQSINKQLAHITYTRVRSPQPWSGEHNEDLHKIFKQAWQAFKSRIGEPYKTEVEKQISRRKLNSEFGDLDF